MAPEPVRGTFVGLATLDVVQRVSRPPSVNEKVTALRQDIAAGGPAANAAVVFAALGGRARLVTALGRSSGADLVRSDLHRHGVEIVDLTPESTTGPSISSITVVDATGDRSVVSTDAGTVVVAAPDDAGALVGDADVVLIDGHHPLVAVAAARAARALRRRVVIDAGRWKPVMADLVPLADDVICSADFRWPGSSDPSSSASAIRHLPGRRVVAVTRGPRPVLWWEGETMGEVPVPAVAAVDTLGAGDAFHGAYAWWTTRPDLTTAGRLARAAEVAALRCSRVGPRAWLAEVTEPDPGSAAPDALQR